MIDQISQYPSRTPLIASDHSFKIVSPVAPALPTQRAEINARLVTDPEIVKRNQMPGFNRIRKPHLVREYAAEVSSYVTAISALWCCGQTQKRVGLNMI